MSETEVTTISGTIQVNNLNNLPPTFNEESLTQFYIFEAIFLITFGIIIVIIRIPGKLYNLYN